MPRVTVVRTLRSALVPLVTGSTLGQGLGDRGVLCEDPEMVDERPHVVIAGAGLAGLSCAERLAERARVTVVEARDRVGGRCWSAHGWADGQVAEHGGELLEAGQDHVLGLAAELGLELESRHPAAPVPGALAMSGEVGALDDVPGLAPVLAALAAEHHVALGSDDPAVQHARARLDEMTARDWLDLHVDGGAGSRTGQAVDLTVAITFGRPTHALSALSLHHMFLGLPDPGESTSFAFGNESASEEAGFGDVVRGGVVETFHVRGGNDQLATGLAARLPEGSVRLETRLTSVRRRPDGRYDVGTDAGPLNVADRVVLATPLPPLRDVDLTGAGLTARRAEAIEQVPMGTHRKLLAQLTRQPGSDAAWPGLAITDAPPTAVWDTSSGQPGAAGLLTFFSHHDWLAAPAAHAPASPDVAAAAGRMVATLAPGMTDALDGRVWLDDWTADPWTGGSYAAFAPGQYTRFAGLLPVAEGGIHFAGEHTSLASFGYLDGAVGSGRRAAAEVAAALFGTH
jgi:monoamine oxidase